MAGPRLARLLHLAGWPSAGHPAGEKLLAGLGGAIGIVLVLALTRVVAGAEAAIVIVPSAGASAVLAFAAPHSLFAQPWAIIGGNVLSALVGVACQRWIPNPALAAGCAVGLAIGIMHVARCIHPPGGATALAAVIGGPAIHQLGFGYALSPVGLNSLLVVLAAVGFNYAFAWRRYPAGLMRYAPVAAGHRELDDRHLREAIGDLHGVVDTSPEEIREIVQRALAIVQREAAALRIQVGRLYCNDAPGPEWSVREVVDERPSDQPELDIVIYRVVEGQGMNRHGDCTRQAFAAWAARELRRIDRAA